LNVINAMYHMMPAVLVNTSYPIVRRVLSMVGKI